MFELFDQFLYIAILMFGAYVTLYIKNRSYSGILLIACSILSNIFLFSIVLDPFIFITLPITAVLLLRDFVEDFKSGIVSRKHKLGAVIAGAIIIYDAIFIIQISAFNLGNSYSLFTVGSIIGTLTGFYLVIYPFKEMMQEREENLQAIYQQDDSITLENRQQQITNNRNSGSLQTVLDEESAVTKEDNVSDTTKQANKPKPNHGKIFGVDSLYIIVGGVVLAVLIASIVFNFVTRTVIDMQDYVFVTVSPDTTEEADVSYYASFEHFDENNFYDDLIDEGEAYGLTETEINKYLPVYTANNAEMFKKLDIKVALDKETVKNGDVVTTNITYNEDYALKHNIVVKNTNFETKINNIPEQIKSIDDVNSDELKQISQVLILGSHQAENYSLESIEPQFAYTTDNGYLQVIVTYSGKIKDRFLSKSDNTVSFLLTPYMRDGELYIPDNIEFVNIDKYQTTEF